MALPRAQMFYIDLHNKSFKNLFLWNHKAHVFDI